MRKLQQIVRGAEINDAQTQVPYHAINGLDHLFFQQSGRIFQGWRLVRGGFLRKFHTHAICQADGLPEAGIMSVDLSNPRHLQRSASLLTL